ncbi:MAG: M56 family metallopeptidase [Steroidobacteraceae bacterium]
MIEWVIEAALRSLAVAGVLRLGIAVFRVASAPQEKAIWTTLLIGGLAMPALLRWPLLPSAQALSFSLPTVAVHGAGLGEQYYLGTAILVLYLGVSVVFLLRLAAGVGRMWWIKSKAVPIREPWTRAMDVRTTREISSPATFGTTILLPTCHASWTDAKRKIILDHEEAHVRHRDSQVQWLAALHAALFWFSPLPWWLRRRLAQLAEYTSDDDVLRRNTDKTDYATVLLEEAQAHSSHSLLPGIAKESIERRVDRILAADPVGRPPARFRRGLAVLSVVLVIALAADAVIVRGQASANAAQNLFAMDASHPFIIAGPSGNDLREYYPAVAQREAIDGLVQITVSLDEEGRATDTLILSETPTGVGFGAAASELAHKYRYSNPTGHPATVTYKVKFELDHSAPGQPAASDTRS